MKKIIFTYTTWYRFVLIAKKLSETERAIVVKHIPFYRKLTVSEKRVFEHRMKRFISCHDFFGREGLLVTEEMKLLISATAVMISFGFRQYLLSQFKTILIYPEHYYSTITREFHKGEANPMYKTIVFSWKDLQHGFEVANDNLNLGIHELAHALHFSFMSENSYSATHFLENYNNLLKLLKNKALQKKLIEAGYIRDYAFENQYEFLSVLIEHFFETPTEFKSTLPLIYDQVRKMLNFKNVAGY